MGEEQPHYLARLNAAQQEAVTHTEGPCMIIAGAGSGKTRVITYRIAHLMESKGVDPFSIMALTFTNKAAREMRQRIEKIAGDTARSLWMGTFHSVFARILRIEADRLGYPRNFTIYDTDDSVTLLKNLIKEMGLDDKLYKPKTALARISAAKNQLITWQTYINDPTLTAEDESSGRPRIGELYKRYALQSFKAGAMDFDDLLLNTDKLLKEHLDVLNKYQHRIHYILVDEFQDTNLCQYYIVRKLAAVRQNICVVGDDAQSIYAFRGADIGNILNFEKDHPQTRTVTLEQNYRSTKTIVGAANSVIAKNTAQLPKNTWTENEEGSQVELFRALSDNEEGKLIANSVFAEHTQRLVNLEEMAVLYRTNSQSRAIEEAMRRHSIKYRIIGGFSFYQRKEVKDLLAYLRFVLNPKDEIALRRIINLPKRGIGSSTVDKLIVAADERSIALWEAMERAHILLGASAANAIEGFVNLIKSCAIDVREKDAYEAAASIAARSGLLKALHEDKTIEGQSRYENAQELLNAIKEFSDNGERQDKSLGAFLQDIALFTTQDEEEDDRSEKVTLMTIHMAKGLEFSHVYIAGLEEELFPSQFMLSSRADLEEERRLFYVALTRAKKKLFLSYALTRYRFGRIKNCEPSRFLHDIAERHIKVNSLAAKRREAPSSSTDYARRLVRHVRSVNAQIPLKQKHTPSAAPFAASDTAALQVGMKVEHPKFGIGTVSTIDDGGIGRKAVIRFEDFGEKTLLLTFAKLKICSN